MTKSDEEDKCGNCGATGVKLMNCTRCRSDKYCSKECQRAAWPKHKQVCKIISRVNKETASGGPQGLFRALEKLNQGGQKIVSLQMTSAGMVSSTDTVVPPGLPSGFFLIREAMSEYNRRTEEKRMFGEASYKALLDSIYTDEVEWARFFSHPANQEHTGEVIIILHALVQVYEGRNSTEEWGHALDVLDNVMDHMDGVLRMSRAGEEYFRAQENFHRSANASRLDLNDKTGNHADSPRLLKALCRHELEHGGQKDVHWMMADQMINVVLKNEKALGFTDISSNILEIPDEIILEGYKFTEKIKRDAGLDTMRKAQSMTDNFMNSILPPEMRMKREEEKNNLKLLHCSNCAKQESACGEFKCCTRCKEVVYCGRACQKAHWKAHKKSCGKK